VVALVWFTPSVWGQQTPDLDLRSAAPSTAVDKAEDLRRQAREAEQQGDWLKACWRYEDILRRDRGNKEAREAYHRCLRRHQVTLRHNDRGYRDALAALTPSDALAVYEQVLTAVRPAFVDRKKSDYGTLFKHGVNELLFALEDESFLREQLSGVPREAIQAFRAYLLGRAERRLTSTGEAREQINAVLAAAYREGLPDHSAFAVAVTLEFASGACSGLDEYTLFFNPSQYGDLMASWRGKYAGVGAELTAVDGQVYVSRVYPSSPAADAQLPVNTRLRRIDGLEVANLPAYYAAERLRGEVGTPVELVVVGPDEMEVTYKLVRRPVAVGTVEAYLVGAMNEATDIGYMRISSFQESTPQEVREGLARLQTDGIKALVVDLRGNPGGSFKSAVEVSELFLPEGSVVVLTQGTVKDFNQPFRVGSMNPFALPMVVLVDPETASAAEVLAGGLKQHGRARLIGQTTFGKGTIQVLIPLDKRPLDKAPGGIRITVARFFWPGRSPDGGRGIVPDDFANPGDTTESLINAARQRLRSAIGMMMQ
jgi:carboxyl-terminal processing protease